MRIGWLPFIAAITVPARAAEIVGKIAGAPPKGAMIETGYVGIDRLGHKLFNMAGVTVSAGASKVTCTTWKPRNTSVAFDPGKGCSFRHDAVPPGSYLLYVKLTEIRGGQSAVRMSDWQVVRVTSDKARISATLSLSSALCGTLAVTAPGRSGLNGVFVTPSGNDGKELIPGIGGAADVGVEADLGPNGVTISGLRAGSYSVKVRRIHRQKMKGGSFATFDELGAWSAHVKRGKVTKLSIPVH